MHFFQQAYIHSITAVKIFLPLPQSITEGFGYKTESYGYKTESFGYETEVSGYILNSQKECSDRTILHSCPHTAQFDQYLRKRWKG